MLLPRSPLHLVVLSSYLLSTAAAAPKVDCSSTAASSLRPASAQPSSSRPSYGPSSAPSSSRPSSSLSLSLPSSSPHPSGSATSLSTTPATDACSAHSTTTRTKYVTVWEATSTSTSTVSETQTEFGTSVVTTTFSLATTSITALFPSTTTSVYSTTTSTSILIILAPTTITVPTAPGFTPFACLPAYLDPTVTSTTTLYTETTVYDAPATVTWNPTQAEYTTTVTTTITKVEPFTVYQLATTIYTSTRADATRTEYAACATNNIVSEGPWDSYLNIPMGQIGITLRAQTLDSQDPVECCELCQADPTCYVSSSTARVGSSFTCFFFSQGSASAPSACNSTYQAADIILATENILDGVNAVFSNSGCGQYYLH